jgi:HAD superfamily hydrolase (TIGR01549 family)
VVFDVDGTLYHQAGLRRAMALRLVRAHLFAPKLGLTTLRILRAYRHAQEALRDAPGGGELAGAQEALASRASGASAAEVRSTVSHWMEQAPLDLLSRFAFPGMPQLIHDLRAAGIKLGVLSDYPAQAKLAALGVGACFDAVLCAQDAAVGVFKPDPRGILVSLERLGVAPSDALYVGDRAEVDAAAAQAAGVACAILSPKPPASDAPYLSVTSYAALRGALAGHFEVSKEPQRTPAP